MIGNYTEKDYKADVESAYKYKERGPLLGAELSAATKRFKQSILIEYLELAKESMDLDLTPTMAVNITKGWVKRSVSRNVLIKLFGTAGRTANNKSKDHEKVDLVINMYKSEVENSMKLADKKLLRIRKELKPN